MARIQFSLNKIQLIGNLGKDADTRFTTDGLAVTSFGLATTSGFKNKEDKWTNETTWHNVTAFKLSDNVRAGLTKGKKFFVEGRLTKNEYTDKDGLKKQSVQVLADIIIPFDKMEGGLNNDTNGVAGYDGKPETDNENDDLPF